MTFILQQLTKRTNIETKEHTEEWTDPDSVEVLAATGRKRFTVASYQSYSDSAASIVEGRTEKTVTHHVTCIELRFQKREVLMRHIGLRDKWHTYDIRVV